MIIFFFSDIPWEGLYQRPHHIAKRFSLKNFVIWIEPMTFSHKPYFKLKHIENNLYIITIPAIPYNARSQSLRKIAVILSSFKLFRLIIQFLQYKIVKKALSNIKKEDNFIFFIENYQLASLISYFKPKLIIYDYIDNALGFTKLPNHVIKTWELIIKKSNFIIATSNFLINQISNFRKENIHLITNGVEYNFFSTAKYDTIPTDLPTNKKIVGYIGAIYPWLDFELIDYLCKRFLDINFVFIGKGHPEVKQHLTNLKKYDNFFYLGFKNYTYIPAYLSRFNMGIIPFKRNILTEGVNPVKLFEYSAMGIPTVCTNFSDELSEYKNLIFIANTKEEFENNIKLALDKSTQPEFINKIKEFAKNNDWDEKYLKINSLIERYLRKT